MIIPDEPTVPVLLSSSSHDAVLGSSGLFRLSAYEEMASISTAITCTSTVYTLVIRSAIYADDYELPIVGKYPIAVFEFTGTST